MIIVISKLLNYQKSLRPFLRVLSYTVSDVYAPEKEHSELIAYFVETVHSESYRNTNIKKITAPLDDYWNKFITHKL